MSNKETKLKLWIIQKLNNRGYWGRRLINIDDLPKGSPSHLRKKVKKLAYDLWKERYLLKKKGLYGDRFSLNPRMFNEIQQLLEKWKKLK